MTKKKRTPVQKLAREIQAATGKPYTECLTEAHKRLTDPAPPEPCPASEETP